MLIEDENKRAETTCLKKMIENLENSSKNELISYKV